jgi:AraC family transcriptional regulator
MYEYTISESRNLRLLGCVYYGNPFHEAKEWSYENEIGKLWQRFGKLSQKYSSYLEKIAIEPKVAYELHLEPEEYQKSKNYYVFVGIAVDYVDEMPLEFFLKSLPKTQYLQFTSNVTAQDNAEYFFSKWLNTNFNENITKSEESELKLEPDETINSGYEQAFPYILQRYDDKYKGLDDPDSELGWMVPIKKLEEI